MPASTYNMIGQHDLLTSIWLARFARSFKPALATPLNAYVTFFGVFAVSVSTTVSWSSLIEHVPVLECSLPSKNDRVRCFSFDDHFDHNFYIDQLSCWLFLLSHDFLLAPHQSCKSYLICCLVFIVGLFQIVQSSLVSFPFRFELGFVGCIFVLSLFLLFPKWFVQLWHLHSTLLV